MLVKKRLIVALAGWLLVWAGMALAQDAEQQQKEQVELEKKALVLLDQVISETRLLRLPENRLRVQINAADLLWKQDESRARALFAETAAGVAEILQNTVTDDRRGFEQLRSATQLRQELLSTVARRDPKLALDFLRATRPPEQAQEGMPARGPFQESNLETNLLAQIASADPALALRNALDLIEKGQYPMSLLNVLGRLREKDQKLAGELSDTLLRRLDAKTLLANREAASLALGLLQAGPMTPETAKPSTQNRQGLAPTDYARLLDQAINAAMSAQPRTQGAGGNQAQANRRGGQGQRGAAATAPPSDQEVAQSNARMMLNGMSSLLTQIEKVMPARAAQLRQKASDVGVGGRQGFGEFGPLLQQGSVEALLESAGSAPPMAQPLLYRQAAMRALQDGNTEQARSIANQYLEPGMRENVLQAVDRAQTAQTVAAGNIEQARQSLSRLRTNEEKVDLLANLSTAALKQKNQKLASQLLQEAERLVDQKADNYQQLEARAKLARAYAELDPARGLETLEGGIGQLNDLLAAAALLNGFEVNFLREGELPMQGNSGLSRVLLRYGQNLAMLARKDFVGAETAANRFQHPEARVFVRLAITQGVLGEPGREGGPEAFNPLGGRGRAMRQP